MKILKSFPRQLRKNFDSLGKATPELVDNNCGIDITEQLGNVIKLETTSQIMETQINSHSDSVTALDCVKEEDDLTDKKMNVRSGE